MYIQRYFKFNNIPKLININNFGKAALQENLPQDIVKDFIRAVTNKYYHFLSNKTNPRLLFNKFFWVKTGKFMSSMSNSTNPELLLLMHALRKIMFMYYISL